MRLGGSSKCKAHEKKLPRNSWATLFKMIKFFLTFFLLNGVVCLRATVELLILLVGFLATTEVRREGWLDRVVSHQKKKFYEDVKALVPIKATIIPKPQGYVDSKDWNYDSVMHLIILLKGSKAAAPVHRALRRAMRPTRRMVWNMKMADTFRYFPSLAKSSVNDFEYDVDDSEEYEDELVDPTPADTGVIIVSNPVEAKLPSSQISIELLKDIMIQRAIAARKMHPKPANLIPWEPINATNNSVGNTTDNMSQNGTDKTPDGEGDGSTGANKSDGQGPDKKDDSQGGNQETGEGGNNGDPTAEGATTPAPTDAPEK